MVIDAVLAVVVGRDDHRDCLALGAAQAGLAEHQRHVEIEVIAHRLGIETVDLQDIRDLAALLDERRVPCEPICRFILLVFNHGSLRKNDYDTRIIVIF